MNYPMSGLPQTLHVYLRFNGSKILCGIDGQDVVTVGFHGFKVYCGEKYAQIYTPCGVCEARYPLALLGMLDI